MTRYLATWIVAALILTTALSCKHKEKIAETKDLADLTEQTRAYVTTESTQVRVGPGPQFRAIGSVGRDAKVSVVGREGEWVLIVSKKGNAPGYIELATVRPAGAGEMKEALNPQLEGRYETVIDTQVRSGPGLHFPEVAKIPKGTALNVVQEDKGWLKVESKRGNKPGYVDGNAAKPVTK
jgi:uncharacterized protein YgiM (DUF1202 family)